MPLTSHLEHPFNFHIGKDVVILQNLLPRSNSVTSLVLPIGFYDKQTASAVAEYKKANMLERLQRNIILYIYIYIYIIIISVYHSLINLFGKEVCIF